MKTLQVAEETLFNPWKDWETSIHEDRRSLEWLVLCWWWRWWW